jgi:hypothetical protein
LSRQAELEEFREHSCEAFVQAPTHLQPSAAICTHLQPSAAICTHLHQSAATSGSLSHSLSFFRFMGSPWRGRAASGARSVPVGLLLLRLLLRVLASPRRQHAHTTRRRLRQPHPHPGRHAMRGHTMRGHTGHTAGRGLAVRVRVRMLRGVPIALARLQTHVRRVRVGVRPRLGLWVGSLRVAVRSGPGRSQRRVMCVCVCGCAVCCGTHP